VIENAIFKALKEKDDRNDGRFIEKEKRRSVD
jgi:hypothetical protein